MTFISIPDTRWGTADPTHDPVILANFRPRPDDVLITTAPKAGTTWMQNILHQLRSGGDPDFSHIDEVVPWLELPRPSLSHEQVLEQYDAMTSPRLFKTHCTYEQTPGVDTVRIILSSRDPRDCMVSFYHHVMDMTDDARKHSGFDRLDTFDDVFELWMSFGAWYRNMAGWWPHFNDHNLLWLRYEDMKQDSGTMLSRICTFLDWDLGHEQMERVKAYISFDWMKAHTEKFTTHFDGRSAFKPGGFIRKGAVGDHRNSLSREQASAIIDRAHRELAPECIAFLGL
jgi:hypothetical protein